MKHDTAELEVSSKTPRRLVCLILGKEIKAADMTTLRQDAQKIVDEKGDPRGGPYHVCVREGDEIINEFALCHSKKRREYVISSH